jgi:putative tryptophan/tyrosine transport system substrate-binding protein
MTQAEGRYFAADAAFVVESRSVRPDQCCNEQPVTPIEGGRPMDRGTFLRTLGTCLLAAPISAGAQQAGEVARIGYLSNGTATVNAGFRQAFTDGLRDHGWIEERNIAIEYRWQGDGALTLDALAAELVRRPLDLIFAVNTPAALATKRTGTTLPVVFAQVSEPVAIGLVESLARPGRNFTGLTTINRELMSKRLELLKETIPGLTRVGYLANPGYEVHKAQLTENDTSSRRSARAFRVRGAFARMATAHVGAFIVQQDDLRTGNRTAIIDLAGRRRLPGMYVSAFIRGLAGSCPMELTPRTFTDVRPTMCIKSSKVPNHPLCRWNGRPSSSWRSISRPAKRSGSPFRRRCCCKQIR